jgi:hypothetical protein
MKTLFRVRFLALLLLVVTASGCFTVRYSIPSERQGSAYDVLGSFEVKKKVSWVIFGLVPLSEAQVEEIVRREVERRDGDAATNVTVVAQFDAVDVVVAALVGGLFNTRTYTVSGDVVRIQGGTASVEQAPPPDGRVILGEIRYQEAARR